MIQATALEILKSGTNTFLTGEPGSGKTYVVNQYIAALRSYGLTVAITASTGIAATHISGTTIHSWSGIGIKDALTKHDFDFLARNDRLAKKIRLTNVLIIDEISMLSAGTLDMVELVCRTIRGSAEPFGGLQVVLVGDFFQLPPISKSGEQPVQFAFEAACWRESLFTVCYLTEQHRQSDAALSSVLAAIRGGVMTKETTSHLTTRRVHHHSDQASATKLYAHNLNVDKVNSDKLDELEAESRVFTMQTKGQRKQIESLVRGCLSPEELELKIGAAVMCTRNNPELGFVNGTLGTVIGFDTEEGFPIIETRQGREIIIPPTDWAIEDGENVTASITQIPLRLAWAMTVHKSQGMSLDAAMMDLSRSFAYGQGYVALSRVRTLSGLYLLGWNKRALMIDPAIQAQDAVMRKQSVKDEQAWFVRPETEQKKQQEDFIRAGGGRLNRVSPKHETSPRKNGAGDYAQRLIELRKRYPKAYTPWTKEADAVVTSLYQNETSVKQISEKLERQPGAIRSRLKHLGLTQ